jgi:transposase
MAKKKINDELGKLIIKYYTNENRSATEISKLLNISTATICSYLKSQGITVINKQNIPVIDKELGNTIINLYITENFSISKISKNLGISITTICKYLRKQNIEIINYQNRSKFNENIFDKIDSEEKAYWLGFIFADGYISNTRNTFEIGLSIKDLSHLEKFNDFMEHESYNIKISKDNKGHQKCRWSVVNKHLWNTLNNYGCTPRKSTVLKFPIKYIPEKLKKDFIRGYFDGDGCITYDKKAIKPIATVLGTEEFLSVVKNILKDNDIVCNIVIDKRMEKTRVLNVSTNRNNTLKFLDYLYKNSIIYLNRKFKRYEFFKHSRSAKELAELLASENGEVCDDNTVLT